MAITIAPSNLTGDEFRAIFSNAAGLTATTKAATLTVGAPFSIVSFTGAFQTDTVGTAFAPLEAFVADSLGAPVSGSSVVFSVLTGNNGASGAFAGNATVTTNAYGVAIAPALTAGHTAGAFTVAASVSGVASPAVFDLTNAPGAPASIMAVGGASQNTPIGSEFSTAIQAEVVDTFGNPLGGVPVTFFAPTAGPTGSFHALATVPTNALGIATAPAFSANHIVGTFTVTGASTGVVTPAQFTLTNTSIPAAIRTLAGSGQHASVNSAYTTPLKVRVTDAAGNPVVGITVDFELPNSAANGTFAGSASVVTDASGVATAPTLTANTVAGHFTVTAWVTHVAKPATFLVTNLPLGPAVVAVVSGAGQAAALGIAFAKTLQVRVADQYGNPLKGVIVTFAAPPTGASGTFAGHATVRAVTGTNGIANVAITANRTAGNFQVTASVAQVITPATFSLTNSTIHILKVIAGSPQNATANTAYGTPFKVKVLDSAGHPLQGISVTFQAPSSGASGTFATSATVLTDQNGIATAPVFTANGLAGSFTVKTSLTSPVAGVPTVIFSLKNVTPPAHDLIQLFSNLLAEFPSGLAP